MDTVERIETTRFLGSEFALWLWFQADRGQGEIEALGQGVADVSLESRLTLQDLWSGTDRVTIHAGEPALAPEAASALLRGKLPTAIGLRVIFEQAEWLCSLDLARWRVTGLKLPALTSEGDDGIFYERMRQIERLDDLLSGLYASFLRIRQSSTWEKTKGEITAWIRASAGKASRRATRRGKARGS